MTDAARTDALVDRATAQLRRAILSGRLRPGVRLVQQHLADELGISRTPLREALRRLEQDGLVTTAGPRGLTVTELSAADLLDAYDVREVVDGLAARLAAARMDADGRAGLARAHADSEALTDGHDPQAWSTANAEFHRLIVDGAGSAALRRALPNARLSGRLLHPQVFLHPDRIRAAFDDHAAILAAIEARDEAAAEVAGRRHVARVRGLLEAEVRRVDDAPALTPLRDA